MTFRIAFLRLISSPRRREMDEPRQLRPSVTAPTGHPPASFTPSGSGIKTLYLDLAVSRTPKASNASPRYLHVCAIHLVSSFSLGNVSTRISTCLKTKPTGSGRPFSSKKLTSYTHEHEKGFFLSWLCSLMQCVCFLESWRNFWPAVHAPVHLQ